MTARCFSRIKEKRVFIANSRTILGAQGRLATLATSDLALLLVDTVKA